MKRTPARESSPPPERLAAVDEANLVLDRPGQVNVFLVALALSAGGVVDSAGGVDLAALRDTLSLRIGAIPALGKRLVDTTRGHAWAHGDPDLAHHVRLVAAVEGLAGLENTCAELMTVPLDYSRPLWEMLVVPGVEPHRAAIVLRIHHAIADGMAAVAIVHGLFDPDPARDPAPAPVGKEPEAVPRPTALRRVGRGLRRIRAMLGGGEVGDTVLLGARSDHRSVVFVDADLRALEERGHRHGVTVNDALLAAVACGYRAALAAAGERLPVVLPVSVPVALTRRGTSGNQVGVMLVRLPIGEADADERLRLIAAQTRIDRVAARQQGTLEFMRGPLGASVMDRLARRQHLVAGFVTNVRGPEHAQHLAGALIERMSPVAVIAGNVRLGVAALSSDGRLACSVHFDADAVPGAAFARAMSEELDRLSS